MYRYYYQHGPAATADYIASVLTLSPTAFWPMQESSGNIADATGNGWTGTAVGASITYGVTGPTINGEAMKAITLPGSSAGYFTVASTLTDPATSGFTVSAWAKHPAAAGARGLFVRQTTNQGCFTVSKGNSYGMQGVLINTANGAFLNPYHGTDLADSWVFTAVRYDSGGTPTATVWTDATTATDTATSGTWKRDGDPNGFIGSYDGSGYWDGELCLLAYWNGPLSDADITKLRTGVF